MSRVWSRVPAEVRDWVIATGVAAALFAAGLSAGHPAGDAGVVGYALLVGGGLALAARRRVAVAVLFATGLSAVGYQVAGFDVPAVAFLFAVYAAMREGHRVSTAVSAVAMLTALPVAVYLFVPNMTAVEALAQSRGALEIAWLIAAAAAGEALRQAERRADEAERTREETALRRAGEERLHLARELHDSLTHQISVIKVQAAVAVHLARKRQEDVPPALLAIEEASREAARELRSTLQVLRDENATPQRGLDQVPDLVDHARAAGLDATIVVEGRPHDVTPAVDRTAYRIVQESLTNIARHANAAKASVRIGYRAGTLSIQVDDDGIATPSTSSAPGVGLVGMRERVTALGGRLHARPRPEGGFTVHAELPVELP